MAFVVVKRWELANAEVEDNKGPVVIIEASWDLGRLQLGLQLISVNKNMASCVMIFNILIMVFLIVPKAS